MNAYRQGYVTAISGRGLNHQTDPHAYQEWEAGYARGERDMQKQQLTVVYEQDGEIIEETIPSKYDVCPTCRGRGLSSAYLGTFTAEDMAEDPDFARDYAAGRYDRECETCDGLRVVLVPDRARMTEAQRAAWDADEADRRMCRAEEEGERRMLYGMEY